MEILKVKTENRRIGDIGEDAAVKLLKKKKFKIIKRNYVAVNHEIDIIAENKDVQIFVEVKCREDGENTLFPSRPAFAVDAKKQRAIVKAASYYTSFNPSEKKKRFDVIEVYTKRVGEKISVVKTNHIEGAFTKNDAYRVIF